MKFLRWHRIAGAVGLMAVWSAATVAAAQGLKPPLPDAETAEEKSLSCLAVHSPDSSESPLLRLALPPGHGLAGLTGLAPLQQMMGRVVAPSQAGAAAGSAPKPQGWPAALDSPRVSKLIYDGGAEVLAGRFAAAESLLAECSQTATQEGNTVAEGACANNHGVALAALGRHSEARSKFEWALQRFQAERKAPSDSVLPDSVQKVLSGQSSGVNRLLDLLSPAEREAVRAKLREKGTVEAERAQTKLRSGQAEAVAVLSARGAEMAMLNLGNLAFALGQLAQADQHLRRALAERPAQDWPPCRAAAAADLARLQRKLNQPAEAAALLQRHPPPAAPRQGEAPMNLVELGAVLLPSQAAAGAPLAASPKPGARTPIASPSGGPSVGPLSAQTTPSPLLNEPMALLSEGALAEVLEATRKGAAGQPQTEREWRRLALRASAAERPDLAYTAHAALMQMRAQAADPAGAAYHGKQAALLSQAVRARLGDGSPSRDARRALLRERRQVYVDLTQLLMDQQRLQEAEQTLQLLKEDEGQQFAGGPAVNSLGGVTLSAAEAEAKAQQDQVADSLRSAERKRAEAALRPGVGAFLALPKQGLEDMRLSQVLALPSLAAQLRQKPLQAQGTDAAAARGLDDLRSLLSGRDGKLGRLVAHTLEDAPKFSPAPSPAQLRQMQEVLSQLPQIQRELEPLLQASGPPGKAIDFRIGLKNPFRKEDKRAPPVEPIQYALAETLVDIWRAAQSATELEASFLKTQAGVSSVGQAGPAPVKGKPDTPLDTPSLLARLATPTALLYYLPGDTRLDVLLVSGRGHQHWRLALTRQDLDTQANEFRRLLARTDRNPEPAAQALYEMLFAPVAQAVANTGAQVVALSLSGALRFVPFAALHDGKGWLVERYALALHPGGNLAQRLKAASGPWQVAAFGAAQGGAGLSALPSVPVEIASVVRQGNTGPGALPGRAFLNQAFTAQALQTALRGGSQVLHIASHFSFTQGDAAASFLLLGDGQKLSLQELATPAYRLDRFELVTLSACQTGLSADDAFGQEVDGLAALLMGQGAPSVLASLWQVADDSTARLMASLYGLRERNRSSRVQALRQAQLGMIQSGRPSGQPGLGGAGAARGMSVVPEPGDGPRAPAAAGPSGHAHPYHWAPFILMGNWL